jgi:hypothetical protein
VPLQATPVAAVRPVVEKQAAERPAGEGTLVAAEVVVGLHQVTEDFTLAS